VLALLKIYGYALGMPNPGLLPTAKERDAQRDVVANAIARLEKLSTEADGQVAMTRHPAKVIASVAKRRQVHHVIIEQPRVSQVRRFVEGDAVASVRRRLGSQVEVVVIESATGAVIPRRSG
jgi:K+-sensing histidine kinase KdpD